MANPKIKLLLIIFQFAWGKCHFPNDPFAPAWETDGAMPFGYYPSLGEEDHLAALTAPTVDQGNHDLYQNWNQYAGSFNFEESSSAASYPYEAQTYVAPHVDQQPTGLAPIFDHGEFSQGNNHLHQTWHNAGPSHYSPPALDYPSYQDFQSYYPTYDAPYNPASQTQENDSIDLLEVPLIAYYFAANSKFPYGPSKVAEKGRLTEIILQAINDHLIVDLQMPLEDFNHLIFPKDTSNHSAASLRLGFLGRLCLRNITFLLYIHKGPDYAIQKEVKLTLHWLHEQLKNYPNSKISTTVSEHWQKSFKPTPMVTIKDKKQNIGISEDEAIDTKIIISILDTYYRTSNTTKCNVIFEDKYSFLHFYMKHAMKSLNAGQTNALLEQQQKIKNSNFLPWSNDLISKRNISVFFMDDWHKIYDIMCKRMPEVDPTEWQNWSSWRKEFLI